MTSSIEASGRYTIITADSHCGGSHAQYREYLESKYHDDFDAWRGKYKNPFKDLRDNRRARNWDSEVRWQQQESDGVVAAVLFPNTVPPFFPSFVLFARPPKPDEYEHRLAGIRAHNRWLADFVAECPERRAGIGQIFLNDVDDAIEDLHFIKDNGLRGGALMPTIPPDVTWLDPLYSKAYDRVWAEMEELGLQLNSHGGTGVPNFGKDPVADLLYASEVRFYGQRPFVHLLLSGVFERFPRLKFVMTEMGCAWLPGLIRDLDTLFARARAGRGGELRYTEEHVLPKSAMEYFRQNCWIGVSQPGPDDAAAREVLGVDRFMWGSDYPHDEGTYPYTREHLRQLFHATPSDELQQILAGNVARLYDFDLDALAPFANKVGPTIGELAQPLTELPEHPNEALLKSVG